VSAFSSIDALFPFLYSNLTTLGLQCGFHNSEIPKSISAFSRVSVFRQIQSCCGLRKSDLEDVESPL
jgi:hypothetical protein